MSNRDEPERNQDITKERKLIEIYESAFRLILTARKRGLGIHYAEGVVRGAIELEEMKEDPKETSDEQTPANQTATLRDQFAMAALTGLLASHEMDGCCGEIYARDAYDFADAMLNAREDKQP